MVLRVWYLLRCDKKNKKNKNRRNYSTCCLYPAGAELLVPLLLLQTCKIYPKIEHFFLSLKLNDSFHLVTRSTRFRSIEPLDCMNWQTWEYVLTFLLVHPQSLGLRGIFFFFSQRNLLVKINFPSVDLSGARWHCRFK